MLRIIFVSVHYADENDAETTAPLRKEEGKVPIRKNPCFNFWLCTEDCVTLRFQ